MNPYLTRALAEQRMADMRAAGAAHRLAAAARASHGAKADGTLARGGGRRIPSLSRRRYRQVELLWPDGVSSVVPAESDHAVSPLASSRR